MPDAIVRVQEAKDMVAELDHRILELQTLRKQWIETQASALKTLVESLSNEHFSLEIRSLEKPVVTGPQVRLDNLKRGLSSSLDGEHWVANSSEGACKKPFESPRPGKVKHFKNAQIEIRSDTYVNKRAVLVTIEELIIQESKLYTQPVFAKAVSQELYPSYKDVVDNPIDLETLSIEISGIQISEFKWWFVDKQLRQMICNSVLFNGPDDSDGITRFAFETYRRFKERLVKNGGVSQAPFVGDTGETIEVDAEQSD